LGEARSCAWWFFGAMLVVPAIDRLFTDFGYTLIVMVTGPWPGINGGALYLVSPVALALGLGLVLSLSWFFVARRGAPWLLWLVPLAYSLVRLGGLAVDASIQWRMASGLDSALFGEWLNRELTSWPYVWPQVYVGALVGYPLAAFLGSWLGRRTATRVATGPETGHA